MQILLQKICKNLHILLHFAQNKNMKYVVSYIGNFFWKIIGGVWLAIFWGLIGTVFALTIVGFPLAVKVYKIAWVSWKPSSRRVAINIERHLVLNLLWTLVVGWLILPFFLISMIVLIVSVFGLPLLYQWVKVLKVCLFPFGAIIK